MFKNKLKSHLYSGKLSDIHSQRISGWMENASGVPFFTLCIMAMKWMSDKKIYSKCAVVVVLQEQYWETL